MKGRDLKSKPPYLLGLLGLIPLVGAFVGVALILYGVFKYKSKLLVIIGVLGITFSILVYSLIYYNMKYGKGSGELFAELSQQNLNSLVKDIEFFKQKSGSYPDNLEELQKADSLVDIHDALITRKMETGRDSKFIYRKLGDKYTLFSVGIDDIPNTADDIYPTIAD